MNKTPSSRIAAAFIGVLGFAAQSYAIPLTPTSITMGCLDEGAPNPPPTSDTQCYMNSGSVAGTVSGNEFSWWFRLADPTFLHIDQNPSDPSFKVSAHVQPLDTAQPSLFTTGAFTLKLLGLDDSVLVDFTSTGNIDSSNWIERSLSSIAALNIKSMQLTLTCIDQDLTTAPDCPSALNLDLLVFEKKIGFKPDPNNPTDLPIFDRNYMRIQEAPPRTVPEPSTLALLGLGVAGLAVRRKRLASL